MHPDLEKLIRLQETELQIKSCQEQIEELPKQLAALEVTLNGTLNSLDAIKRKLVTIASDKRRLEGDISDLEQKNSKYRQQLLEVKTNEQYRALLSEIEFNAQRIRVTEDDILAKMEAEEKLKREAQEVENRLQKEKALVETEQKTARELVARDESILLELQNQRQVLIQAISPDVFEKYSRISRVRRGVALARATEASCQACHVRIRPHVLSQVMSGDSIVSCDSCSRILYWKSEAPYELVQ